MTARKVRLVDVRQFGPNREREISGVCSACEAVLLARVDDAQESPTAQQLQSKLITIFESHVRQSHEG
ncbi:MAG TPA: hypothetical protein VIW67_10800 [Terriglobales bacterium]|jgi:hypothetical protein